MFAFWQISPLLYQPLQIYITTMNPLDDDRQLADFMPNYPAQNAGVSLLLKPQQAPESAPPEATKRLTIKEWADDDKPREKLMAKGRQALSDAELIGIILGSGTPKESAVDVARNLLRHAGGSLEALGKMTLKEMTRVNGIGPARAVTLTAMLELGRRRRETTTELAEQMTSSQALHQHLTTYLHDLHVEEFYVLFLNRGLRVTRAYRAATGSLTGVSVDHREVFREAIMGMANSIALAHNHPSGNVRPSQADDEITRLFVHTGHLVGIPVVDHIIYVDRERYFSYTDEGRLSR